MRARSSYKVRRRLKLMTAVSAMALVAAGFMVSSQSAAAAADMRSQSETTFEFRIPAQPLSSALIMLSSQADLVVVASPTLLQGKNASPVEGSFSLDAALRRLLAGSGLRYEITGDRRLILRPFGTGKTSSGNHPSLTASAVNAVKNSAGDDNNGSGSLPDRADKPSPFEEIVVTGSHIRGAAGVGSKLFIFDQADIQKGGFSTVQDVIQSLPQNFGGGPNALTTSLQGTENGAQFASRNFGASVNLRGLGASATLTVINGRRIAPVGAGAFVDISTIPLSVVERVEVLPDGASALYGTDAIAGVTNIILKKDYDGAETRLRFGSVTSGGQQEYKASQLFGSTWDGGSILLSYEYHKIDPLFSAERAFTATSDLRTGGGNDYRLPFNNPGTLLAAGQSFAIPAGQDGTALAPGALIAGTRNLGNERRGTTLFPEQERHSGFVSLHQEVTPWLRLFAEGLYSHRQFEALRPAQTLTLAVPASNPFFVDPIGGLPAVQVQYSFFDDLGPKIDRGTVEVHALAAGASADIGRDWRVDFHATHNRSQESGGFRSGVVNMAALMAALANPDPATAFNPFGDGAHTNPATLQQISGFVTSNQRLELWSLDLKADGPLFAVPGGMVKLAVGGHFRKEDWFYERVDFEFMPTPTHSVVQDMDREVRAAFAELLIPLVGEANRRVGIERLDLSAAVRVEDYSDFGSTTNPRFGLSWAPVSGVSLRGTYGTSFRAPLLLQRDGSQNQVFFFPLPDPKSPSGVSNAILLTGNDADLGPETATTWTAGIDFEPTALAGFRLSATYFETRFKDRLGQVTDLGLLARDDIFAPLISRNPAAVDVVGYFSDPRFVNVVGSTDPNDVDVVVNARLTNLSRTVVRGLDLTAQYGIKTTIGDFTWTGNASLLFDFKEAVTEAKPFADLVDTLDRPVDWRARNSLSWSRGDVTATLFVNYTDSYANRNVIPAETVGSWTTMDVSVIYWTGDRGTSAWLQDVGMAFSIQNVFNSKPPFVNNPRGVGFDPEKANPQGRFIALEIIKRW